MPTQRKPTAPKTKPYWAFISYTHSDKKWAHRIHKALERYRIPSDLVGQKSPAAGECIPKRFYPICIDDLDMKAAPKLDTEIKRSLRDAHWLIVICSTAATQAPWVNKEIETFREHCGDEKVLAIIVDHDRNEKDAKRFFPSALRDIEPLAADVRGGRDGSDNAVVKLLAGMLGVSFDALKRRDLRRKIILFQVALACALALAAIIASLAYYANTQRSAAVHAQQQTVEHLDFMLRDLKDSLEPLGKLSLLEQLVSKTRHFAEQAADTEDLRYLKSVACLSQGDIALTAGNSSLAKEAFQEALLLRKRLFESNPLPPENRIAYAEALSYMGKAQALSGDYSAALSNQLESIRFFSIVSTTNSVETMRKSAFAYEATALTLHEQGRDAEASNLQKTSLSLLRSALRMSPSDYSLQRQLATSIDKLGNIDFNLFPKEALDAYTEAIRLRLSLADKHSADLPLQEDISRSWESFAARNLATGNTFGALRYYNKTLSIRRNLTQQDPLNATWQHLYAQTLAHLADVVLSTNNLADAASYYQTCSGIYHKLASQDPQNTIWQNCKISVAEKQGDILRAQAGNSKNATARQKIAQALIYYQTARAARERLYEAEPKNTKWLSGLSISDLRFGDFYYSQGDLKLAMRYYEEAIKKREYLVAHNDKNWNWHFMLCVAYGKASQVYVSRQDWTKADQYITKRLDILEMLLKKNPHHSLWVNECALVHYRIGSRIKDASPTPRISTDDSKKHLERARDLFLSLKQGGLVSPLNDSSLNKIQAIILNNEALPLDPFDESR